MKYGKVACRNRQAKKKGQVPVLKQGTLGYLADLRPGKIPKEYLTEFSPCELSSIKKNKRAVRKALYSR